MPMTLIPNVFLLYNMTIIASSLPSTLLAPVASHSIAERRPPRLPPTNPLLAARNCHVLVRYR